MNAVKSFLLRVRKTGVKRHGCVTAVAMGRERTFEAWDIGSDTFIFERGIAAQLSERPSVLLVEKADLRDKARGRVMTVTTGNHSVAAFPLLDGRFWNISTLPKERRSATLAERILCANVVGGTIEISQREASTERLVAADRWLLGRMGFGLEDVVMGERNDRTLDHYRACGQEWRVRPLAWTDSEMKAALAAARKRIASRIQYYHSAKGVHFLTLSAFRSFADLAQTAPDEFVKGLRELASVYEGNQFSFIRMPKHRGHHEIEFFGIRRGLALNRLVPEVEALLAMVDGEVAGRLTIIQKAQEIVATFESLLTSPDLADERSRVFTETMYMYITGEIYAVVGEGSTPAFDDRRTALPGATFVGGQPARHPGTDARSEVLLANLTDLMSKDETVEYANIYELRNDDDDLPIGEGSTREIVYKTNRAPLERSLIEKRLSQSSEGYCSYMLSRVQALKGLGVNLSEYRILRRHGASGRRPHDYFIRRRCEGEPMDAIPRNYFCKSGDSSTEEKEIVLALAGLMGDAAAQNMVMKKYDPKTQSPLFGVGKEIYEFQYDIRAGRMAPKDVSTCSIRGSFGWPSLAETDENLRHLGNFYMAYYAHALKEFQRRHSVTMDEVAGRFMNGFEYRTRAMGWKLHVMRDKFAAFAPDVGARYGFARKWRFVMWSLDRQVESLDALRRLFLNKVELEKKREDEDVWHNPQ